MGDKTVQDLIAEGVEARMAEVEKKYDALFNKQAPAVHVAEKDVDGSITAARFIKTMSLARGDAERAKSLAGTMYAKDARLNGAFEKALTATVPSDGGFTIDSELASEIIMPLYNQVTIYQAGARRYPMPKGNLAISRIDSSSAASYVGESTTIAKTQPAFGQVKLSGRKLRAAVPFSNDLLRSNDLSADQAVRDDLMMALRTKMNYTAYYGIGSEHTPAGLDALLPSGQKVGTSSTAFTADIPATLYGMLRQANVPMLRPCWIINGVTEAYLLNLKTTTGAYIYRDEMFGKKTIVGQPYLVDNQVSYTAGSPGYVDIWLGDFSEYLIGEQVGMEIETSREASYNDGGTLVSAFDRDETVIRALMVHDFNVRHTASFVKGTYKLATS